MKHVTIWNNTKSNITSWTSQPWLPKVDLQKIVPTSPSKNENNCKAWQGSAWGAGGLKSFHLNLEFMVVWIEYVEGSNKMGSCGRDCKRFESSTSTRGETNKKSIGHPMHVWVSNTYNLHPKGHGDMVFIENHTHKFAGIKRQWNLDDYNESFTHPFGTNKLWLFDGIFFCLFNTIRVYKPTKTFVPG